jgi:hypothetical protein
MGVKHLDEETQESEDWADRDLRELRAVPAAAQIGRRLTLNGIDVAPRSELSPPIVSPDATAAATADDGSSRGKGLLGKFKNSSATKTNSNDSFYVEGSVSKKGTLARISSKLREKKQKQVVPRKSNSDIFNKSAADLINDSLTAGTTTPESTSGKSTLRGHQPQQAPLEVNMRNGHDLFRFVLEHALDPDEMVLQSYVFTLAYFADPVHILSDLITEHDVAVASLSGGGGTEADGEEAVSPMAERAMKVISFWVAHVWYQFEGSESLMNLLTHFVSVNLKGRRWGNRLSDTMDTLVEGRKVLRRSLEGLLAHGKGLASREDVFAEIDPDDQEDVGFSSEYNEEEDDDSGEYVANMERNRNNSEPDEVMPKEDVTATFVGAETYTDKSRPMGLADLLGELNLDVNNAKDKSASKAAGAGGKQDAASTMVGAHKYNPSSRPMGLFGLLEGAEEQKSIWDHNDKSGEPQPQSLSFAEDGSGVKTRTTGAKASDVAKQLTMIECVLWKLVSPLELQRALWKNEDEERGNYVRQVIGWHNRVAAWVQYEVLNRGTNVTERVKAIQRFLTVCLHLEKLQNYHSLFGIMAGLKGFV